MNNKTYGSRPAPRGYVNADGTVIRPRKPNGPPPSNAPRHKARAVYGAQPSNTAPPRATPPRSGTVPRQTQGKPMPARKPQTARPQPVRPAAPARPPANAGQKKRPPQGQRPAQPARPPQKQNRKKSEWIYPDGGGRSAAFDFERYYRQRRQEELRRQRQRQERARREALRQKKLRRKKRLAQARGILIRFLIVFLLICGITAGAYYKTYHKGAREKYTAVTYTVGAKDTFEASASAAYYDGVLYMDFTRLASFLEMPMAGSIHYMRFIIPSGESADSAGTGTEEAVLFTVGSFTASINGVNINMAGPCRLIGTSIWVPLSFVEHYMSGVTVEHVKSDEISLTRTVIEGEKSDNKQGEGKTEPLAFRVKPQKPIDPVVYEPDAAA